MQPAAQGVLLVAWPGRLPGEFAVRRVHRGVAPTSSYWMYGGVGAGGALLGADYLADVPGRATSVLRLKSAG
ncbi:hypothetical protein SAMN04488074_13080 [Lentzea albidocapillata subsp. violacea]|uniref:Uncharacterized protein n=1 Tax=Lentzea albidocapillata subsp. violacea TaxID=128104 RepID=A0A1G9XM66_9PSEU|nr:hypothetical protein SAMN04488074_13080 [Lentzea albidocapillata subsp. violacea]